MRIKLCVWVWEIKFNHTKRGADLAFRSKCRLSLAEIEFRADNAGKPVYRGRYTQLFIKKK